MNRQSFLNHLQELPILNTHAHHLPDEAHRVLTLHSLLQHSYVNWCGDGIPDGSDTDAVTKWLGSVRTRNYFVWLEKALMSLYGLDKPLDVDSWDAYDAAIQNAHRDPTWHLRMLKERCHYEAVAEDAYWAPGDDNGHPELFRPAYRINAMFYGFNREARDHNGNNFQEMTGIATTSLPTYLDQIAKTIQEKRRGGARLLKCALAYDRPLSFEPDNVARAQNAMSAHPGPEDIAAFQSRVFDHVCELAAATAMPVQIHTGLGLMRGTNAMNLQPLIARHPNTMFLLMHGSYPWTHEIAGLTHAYRNVWADLCWLPLISTTAAHRLLHELIEVCNADRIVWGCDTWTSEESFGARMAFLEVLSRVLTERVEASLLREADATRLSNAFLYDNAATFL